MWQLHYHIMKKLISLSAFELKLIAVICMIGDHYAWLNLHGTEPAAMVLHFFGRIAAPVMCFFVAEGFLHTRSIKKYLARMAVFSLISALAYNFYKTGSFFKYAGMGIIYTLFLGLLACTVLYRTELMLSTKYLAAAALIMLSYFGDWGITGALLVVLFASRREHASIDAFRGGIACVGEKLSADFEAPRGRSASDRETPPFANYVSGRELIIYLLLCAFTFIIALFSQLRVEPKLFPVSFYQLGMLLFIPLIRLYNGKLGAPKWAKWLFYVIYPLQFIVLKLLS